MPWGVVVPGVQLGSHRGKLAVHSGGGDVVMRNGISTILGEPFAAGGGAWPGSTGTFEGTSSIGSSVVESRTGISGSAWASSASSAPRPPQDNDSATPASVKSPSFLDQIVMRCIP